jgi:Na+:H+ antiporter, NhaA family
MPSENPIVRVPTFLDGEAAGGIVLMAAAALAMVAANSPLADLYFETLHAKLGPLSLLHWINDGLMAVFFLLVGLEIKRELVEGELATWRARVLPTIAAASGMIVPAAVYLLVAPLYPRGWAIPSATDIAFAIGVMALLGSRVPTSLKLFLTAVAIVDDMGAVVIIAIGYTSQISGPALLAAAAVMSAMFVLNRTGVVRLWPYLILAALLWAAVLLSGVHATVAGVLAASLIPARTARTTGGESPLCRLEHRLEPWVAFAIVPIFGFANAGVALGGMTWEHLVAPVPLGIAAGLFFGKQLGVFSAVRLSAALRIASVPVGASWTQVYGVALLCGVGFTMSLFIGGLAFSNPLLTDEVKIGVLIGSILSAVTGYTVLRFARPLPAAVTRP